MTAKDLIEGVLANPWLPPKNRGGHIVLSKSDEIFLREMEEVSWAKKTSSQRIGKEAR